MNDKELAYKVIAFGVGESMMPASDTWLLDSQFIGNVHGFVRDWRVAGALMEKVREQGFQIKFNREFVFVWTINSDYHEVLVTQIRINKSLPRAIIEAYVEASENG